ncbi:PEP-CTERM sorting domain-containing protein [Thioalkalivibrio sp. XN8]|uniref:PEP-CTERM sorting domain-containing protein n=1 Tax=Thioalkalivibrio sp. XN8 TaxID=2712863 RepID=UPI0013EA70DB|nr:PEP-CTERM sorting domain-containing protein [Thioalkalivibrio sp. XN8]NGP53670.1 PEP-CTERM sorting domain-containing protein [Thioalkalivibrio sp. XN8]
MIRKISKALKVSAVALPLACFSGTASADLILDQSQFPEAGDPTSATLGAKYDYSEFENATIDFGQLEATKDGQVKFQYLYKEAGYTNSLVLTFNGQPTVFTTGSPPASGQWSSLFNVVAGALPFGICTDGGNSIGDSMKCAYNDDPASLIEQYGDNGYRSIGFLEETPTSWVLFWDDSGATNDDDYDDLVARIHFVAAVPEPGTLALLGLGLLGVGLMRRRG